MRIGKGQMGSALMESLQMFMFCRQGDHSYLPKSARAYLFPKFFKTHYFRSGPISADPICPQPRRPRSRPTAGPRPRGTAA